MCILGKYNRQCCVLQVSEGVWEGGRTQKELIEYKKVHGIYLIQKCIIKMVKSQSEGLEQEMTM